MFLIYYIACGEKHRKLAEMSVSSLFLSGYAGKCHVFADGPFQPDYAHLESLTVTQVPPAGVWEAMQMKASVLPQLDPQQYAAVMFLDCDILFASDPTPLLQRAADNPGNLFVAYTAFGGAGRKGRTLNSFPVAFLNRMFTVQEQADMPLNQQMLDSYAIAIAPTAENLSLFAAWQHVNSQVMTPAKLHSDALGLNVTCIRTGRLDTVVFMDECERLNGPAGEGTIVEHYIFGAAVTRMPYEYRYRFKTLIPQPANL